MSEHLEKLKFLKYLFIMNIFDFMFMICISFYLYNCRLMFFDLHFFVSRSVGLFCHADEPGQLCITHGCIATLDTVNSAEVSNFFEAIANHILPVDMGGQFDICVPLAASGELNISYSNWKCKFSWCIGVFYITHFPLFQVLDQNSIPCMITY